MSLQLDKKHCNREPVMQHFHIGIDNKKASYLVVEDDCPHKTQNNWWFAINNI